MSGTESPSGTLEKELGREVRLVRHRFLARLDPWRPELWRFCRALTGSPWEAEDLAQETLLRAFAKLAEVHWEVADARAWLFRIAANLWIDRQRKRTPVPLPPGHDQGVEAAQLGPEVREALHTLARHLPPQERVAVLLKDVFGLELSEVARALETSVGAVKAALHRGRGRLSALRAAELPEAEVEAPPARPAPSPALLDAFVEAFNARDLPRLAALFAEDALAEVVGMVHEEGRAQIEQGSLHHTLFDEAGQPRTHWVEWRGERLVLIDYVLPGQGEETRAVQDVLRLEAEGEKVRVLRYYYFCPQALGEVLSSLGTEWRENGYRYPMPAGPKSEH